MKPESFQTISMPQKKKTKTRLLARITASLAGSPFQRFGFIALPREQLTFVK